LPTLYNPDKKFIAAANNAVLFDTSKYISSAFALDSRAKRINEMIVTGDDYYYRDAQYMQNDILSVYAKEV
jgi:acyl-homoserine lactone acylase PvdQ